jgi:hypothetical protein
LMFAMPDRKAAEQAPLYGRAAREILR